MGEVTLKKRIRLLITFYIIILTVAGITAIPLVWEIRILKQLFGSDTWMAAIWPAFTRWIEVVFSGINATAHAYPFMLYGTDWLAFAHIVIAIAFIGPLRDPVKNLWVIEFGMIACILIIPWGIVFGSMRGIPPFWSLVDFSFGVFGFIPLKITRDYILRLPTSS